MNGERLVSRKSLKTDLFTIITIFTKEKERERQEGRLVSVPRRPRLHTPLSRFGLVILVNMVNWFNVRQLAHGDRSPTEFRLVIQGPAIANSTNFLAKPA